jgi:hypothetical protein
VYKAFRAYELGLLEKQEWHDIANEYLLNLETSGGAAFRNSLNLSGSEDFWKAVDAEKDSSIQIPDYSLGRFEQEEIDASGDET